MKRFILSAFLISSCGTTPQPRLLIESPLLTGMKPEMEKFLSISKPNRTVGSPGHDAAFEYLKKQFETIAAKSKGRVYVQEFLPDIPFAIKNYQKDFNTLIKPKYSPTHSEYKKWKTFTDGAVSFVQKFKKVPGKNLILELPGKHLPDEVVYLGAHYDTITHDHSTLQFDIDAPAPGADDNASGVVAVLAAARQLSQRPHDLTIRFVFFDYEEVFFLGSYQLAKDMAAMSLKWLHPGEKIIGLYNLEMIGWSQNDVKQSPIVKIYTRRLNTPGYEPDQRLAQFFNYGTTKSQALLKPQVLSNGFDRSDNWSFWQWSLPAVCISEDWEKDFNEQNYHTSHDLPSTLNFNYLKEVTLATIEAVDLLSQDPMKPSFLK